MASFQPATDLGDAVDAMRRRLYRRSSDRVLCDFLEDDLEQARAVLDELTAYLEQAVSALRGGAVLPEALFEQAEDPAPLRAIDELGVTLSSLRRRMALVAGRARLAAAPSRSR